MKEECTVVLDSDMEYWKDQEVFICIEGNEPDSDIIIGELYTFDNLDDLQEHLVKLKNDDDGVARFVLHGLLTDAEALPGKIEDGCCFVIARNPIDQPVCMVAKYEKSDIDELAEAIEEVVESSGVGDVVVTDIDDIFILYGYELTTKMCVDEEDIDDERLDTCNGLLETSKMLKKLNATE